MNQNVYEIQFKHSDHNAHSTLQKESKNLHIWGISGPNRFLVSEIEGRNGRSLLQLNSTRFIGLPHGRILYHNKQKRVKFIVQLSCNHFDADEMKLPASAKWQSLSHNLFLLTVDYRHLNATRFKLYEYPKVVFFDLIPKYETNVKYSQEIVAGVKHNEEPLLTGKGEIIAIMDTGLDTSSCLFNRESISDKSFTFTGFNTLSKFTNRKGAKGERIQAYISLDLYDGIAETKSDFVAEKNDHGTHVTGLAAGDDSSCPEGERLGIRSDSKIIFVDVERSQKEEENGLDIPASIEGVMQLLYDSGARIFSNSWGANHNAYTFHAMEIDKFVYFHDDFLVLFAAGNNGPGEGTIGSPATFKNGIAIGASQNKAESFTIKGEYWSPPFRPNTTFKYVGNEENLAAFSSRGPTSDGRTAPLLVAPGEYTLSARAHPGTNSSIWLEMRGTSMATPNALRHFARLRQFIRQQLKQEPSVALLSAVSVTLAHTLRGRDAYCRYYEGSIIGLTLSHHPSINDQGFGRLSIIEQQLPFVYYKDRISFSTFSAPQIFCFVVDEPFITDFSVTIAWTDPPALPYAKHALINNFDLQVSINDTTFYSLSDSTNNVERIRIKKIVKGDRVRVVIVPRGVITILPPKREQFVSLAIYPKLPLIANCPPSLQNDLPQQCAIPGGDIGIVDPSTTKCLINCNTNDIYFRDGECQCIYSTPVFNCVNNKPIPIPPKNLTKRARKLRNRKRSLLVFNENDSFLVNILWLSTGIVASLGIVLKLRIFKSKRSLYT